MLHRATSSRIRRVWFLIICISLILSNGQTPVQAAKKNRPLQQTGCSNYYSTGPGTYTQILTQVLNTSTSNWDIYRADPCAPYNDRVQLTTSPAFDGYPRSNSDATRIVFVSERDGNPEIYMMNADGSGQSRLTNNTAEDTSPAISPDGTKIAFVSERTGNPEIFIMNVDGSGISQLTSNMELDFDPNWSPDGTKIAWVQGLDMTRRVWLMSPDGSSPGPLSAVLKNARRPVWSPSGDRLALEADDNGDGWQDLIEISADGTGSIVVPIAKTVSATYGEDFLMGGWWSDGAWTYLVFTRAAYDVNGTTRTLNSAMLEQITQTGITTTIDSASPPSFYPALGNSDLYAPVTTIQPIPEYSRYGNTMLTGTATDTGASGLASYTVEQSFQPSGPWTAVPYCDQVDKTNPFAWSGTCNLNTVTSLNSGDTVIFRVRATDKAGNGTINPAQGKTTFYSYKASGSVNDTRGFPLNMVQVQSGEAAIQPAITDAQGKAMVYFRSGGPIQANFTRPGYGSHLPQSWPLESDTRFQAVLPPTQNLLSNGDFEAPGSVVASWQTSGDLPVKPAAGISGDYAAQLGGQCDNRLCLSPLEPVTNYYLTTASLVITSDGVTHFLVTQSNATSGGTDTVIYMRPRNGSWSLEQTMTQAKTPSRLMLSGDSTLYFTYINESNMSYTLARKPNVGSWGSEAVPFLNASTSVESVTVDPQNRVHLIYKHTQTGIWYIRREENGSWAGPFPLVINSHNNPLKFLLAGSPDGTLHMVYQEIMNNYSVYPLKPRYAQLVADGSMTADQELPAFYLGIGDWDEYMLNSMVVSASGDVHLLATDEYDSKAVYWKRGADGIWTDPATIYGEWMENYSMIPGPTGDVTILAEQYYGSGVHYFYRPATEMQFTHWQSDLEIRYNSLTAALDERGLIQVVLSDRNYPYGSFFTQLVPPAFDDQAAIQQSVTIPANLVNPTLSFRYMVEQEFTGSASKGEVIITPAGGSPVVVFTTPTNRGSWQHNWINLSPWAGQSITVTFRLNQAAGEWYARLLLDEISLGAWTTPVIQALSPEIIPAKKAAETLLRIDGLNLTGGAQVFIGDLPAAQINEDVENGALLVTLPPNLLPGAYIVRVIFPDGREAIAPRALYLGNLFYFPLINR